MGRGDFFALPRVGNGERNPHGVADAAADQLLKRDAGFDDAVWGHARLGHAKVQRNVGPLLGKPLVDLDHLGGGRSL